MDEKEKFIIDILFFGNGVYEFLFVA